MQLVAFEPDENDSLRNEVRPGNSPGVVLASVAGVVTTNDLSQRVSLVFQPDATVHGRNIGKPIGVRFLGNSSNPIIDHVSLVVDLEGGFGQGNMGDSDGDGLPDAWEIANFGDLVGDGTSDLDRDGLSDAFEYSENLDPNDYDTKDGIPDWVGYLDTVNDEILLSEDFESPDVIGTSTVQSGGKYDKGELPSGGNWVGSSQGYGADQKGLIHKSFGDFTALEDNRQGFYFGYTNSGLTSSVASISHVLKMDRIYVLSFDVARDNNQAQSSYSMELLAFSAQEGDEARKDVRSGSRPGAVLASASGIVISNDMSKHVTIIFKPNATSHAAHVGKALGIRFTGNSSNPILDHVSLKAVDTNTIMPGAPGYLTVEHWDDVPGQTLADLFASQAFYEAADWVYLTPWAKSLSNVGNDYGLRMAGRVIAKYTGNYHFKIASGGECRLFLSTDEKAFNRREMAFSGNPTEEVNSYDGTYSRTVNLIAGNEYYIEVLMKEDGGGDHVSVAWQYLPPSPPPPVDPNEPPILYIPEPFEIIPGRYLKSFMPDAGDLDDDGMLDSWEVLVGLDPQDNGGTNRNQGSYADIDGDGLQNYREYQYNTSPFRADTDGDGMPDSWEVQNGFNPSHSADAEGDSDGDGINNVTEFRLGLSPNSTDIVGPVNLGFDKEITDFPTFSFRPTHPSDLYEAGEQNTSSVAGWQAAIGQHIEIWDEGDGNRYVELQSHLGAHGITQEFQMLPGASVTFLLRYKGRYDSWDGVIDNAFSLQVEGAEAFELRVNGAVVEGNGSVRSHPFMETDTGDDWVSWQYATVTITELGNGSSLTPFALSLVPITTTSGGEEITHGGFVDFHLLPVDVARDLDALDGNWEPMAGKLVKALPGERINLRVDTSNFPSDVTVDGFEWVLPEKVFKDYTTTTNKGELVELEAADLNQQSVGFHFTMDGVKDVRVKFNVDRATVEAKVEIKVEKPTSTFTTEKGVVRLGAGPLGIHALGFMGANNPLYGVKYIASVTTPDGWTDGQFVYSQLIKSKRDFTNPPSGNATVLGDGVTWKHDGPFPYGTAAATFPADGVTPGIHGDSPSEAADSAFRSTIEITESFQTYLMFRPAGTASRHVPLRKINWNWGAKATSADNWTTVTDPVSAADVEGAETDQHPEWDDNAENDEEQDAN